MKINPLDAVTFALIIVFSIPAVLLIVLGVGEIIRQQFGKKKKSKKNKKGKK